MIWRRAAVVGRALLIAMIGCGQHAPADSVPVPVSRGLAAGEVARVGNRVIDAASVGHIAAAQQIPLAAARDLAIRDALFACGAEERALDRSLDVGLSTRALLARRLLQKLRVEAEQAPISDEEFTRAGELRWLDIDRPEGFRTVHAVVRLDASAPEDTRARGLALAESIRAVVLPLEKQVAELTLPSGEPSSKVKRGEDDPLEGAFRRAVEPILKGNHGDLQVKVEPLPPVAADGRVLSPAGERFDPLFAQGAAALRRRGEVSAVVVSTFGAHVIMLLEQTPPRRIPLEERRALLRDDIVIERANAAEEKLLAELRGRSARTSDVDALLALVAVDP